MSTATGATIEMQDITNIPIDKINPCLFEKEKVLLRQEIYFTTQKTWSYY